MTREEERFTFPGQSLPDAEKSQMFGKPCFKINKKAFAGFFLKNVWSLNCQGMNIKKL